jgi:hypothetical protein
MKVSKVHRTDDGLESVAPTCPLVVEERARPKSSLKARKISSLAFSTAISVKVA